MVKKLLLIVAFLIFSILNYKFFESHIFNIHFVDEDENIVAGYYMGKGEKLYSDIFSHKQPIPAVVSNVLQKIEKPNSLYLLIKRHRELVYSYSIIWSLIIIVCFSVPGLIFSIFFEIIKQYQLGNLFLSESLVVFPSVFVLGVLWKILKGNKLLAVEYILFSFSLVVIIFLQFTLILFSIAVLLLSLFQKKINKKIFLFYLLSFFALFIVCLPFVNYLKYFDNLINAIKSIYLGGSGADNPLNIFLYSFARPFTILFYINKSDFGKFLAILSFGYIISFLYLFIYRKALRKILTISFVLLGLGSLRIVYPDKTFYEGFHGLPWLGLFLFLTMLQFYESIMLGKKLKTFLIISSCIFLILLSNQGRNILKDYYLRFDRERDWYVNFSRFYDFGQTIRILSEKNDKIMVLPAEQLIYWQSGAPHATRFLYGYLFVNSDYKKELYDYWKKSPPALIYDEQNLALFSSWTKDYIRLKREGNDTPLFMRKDKIGSIKDWQKNEIGRMKFSILNSN